VIDKKPIKKYIACLGMINNLSVMSMFDTSLFYNESYVMTQIDLFIRKIPYQGILLKEFRQKLFELIKPFKFHYKVELSYTLSIQLFANIVSLVDKKLDLNNFETNYNKIKYLDDILVKVLIATIIEQRSVLKAEIENLRSQERLNKESLIDYLHKLTEHYAKLLFVRVDLYLNEEGAIDVSMVEYAQYMKILRNRMSNKDGCFSGLQGYAWSIEQGEQRGYHCHLLLIYDGHKHQHDFYLASQVGECWKSITNGGGGHYTSNHSKSKAKFKASDSLGVGMIHRDNPQEVTNAINAAMYLVNPEKIDQFLKVKLPKMKTFGTGQYNVRRRRGI
jgi:hypothetical protein